MIHRLMKTTKALKWHITWNKCPPSTHSLVEWKIGNKRVGNACQMLKMKWMRKHVDAGWPTGEEGNSATAGQVQVPTRPGFRWRWPQQPWPAEGTKFPVPERPLPPWAAGIRAMGCWRRWRPLPRRRFRAPFPGRRRSARSSWRNPWRWSSRRWTTSRTRRLSAGTKCRWGTGTTTCTCRGKCGTPVHVRRKIQEVNLHVCVTGQLKSGECQWKCRLETVEFAYWMNADWFDW